MKENLKYVPGFRTNKTWKKIIAIIGYLLMILVLFASTGVTFGDKVLTLIERVLLIFVPFVLITNLGGVRNKLPLYKSKKKSKTIIGAILTITVISIIIANLPKLYSPQFKQEELVSAAKLKSDTKAKVDAKDAADAKLSADTKAKSDAKIKADAKAKNDAKIKSDAKTKADAKLIADAKIKADAKAKADAKIKAASIEKAKAIAKSKALQDKKIVAEKAVENAAIAKKAEYQAWITGQFSAWDGSDTYLVKLVKENLNDDSSFKHVKTTYIDKGTYIIVYMEYRAKNGFGAYILQNVTAKADYKTNTIKIISQNNFSK